MFSYRSLEDRIATDHALRPMRTLVDWALREVGPRFSELYAQTGRPSMAPERLLRALLLQILFSVRKNRDRLLEGDLARDARLTQATGYAVPT